MARNERAVKVINNHGPMGWILFTAWVGAAIYFFQQDPTLWGLILAVLKGAVWPAYVLYDVLSLLGVK